MHFLVVDKVQICPFKGVVPHQQLAVPLKVQFGHICFLTVHNIKKADSHNSANT